MSTASAPDPASFPRAALSGSIPDRFRDVARTHAHRIAIEHEQGALDYATLDGLAGAVAARLGTAPGSATSCVALLLPQGPELIVATLGTLEAGDAYVPLSPQMPPEVWQERVRRTHARALLTLPSLAADARRAVDSACAVHEVDLSLDPAPPGRTRREVLPSAPACVYFTSGTTGPARGVLDSHGNILHNVMRYTLALGFCPADRMTVIQAATFSGVMSSTFGALLNGATLLPFDLAREGAGPPLARWLMRTRPTIYHSVPSIFRSVCTGVATFPSVRAVRLEGDVATPRDVELFRRHFGRDALLANGLGATETGLVVQWIVRPGTAAPERLLPVGFPVTDMAVEIVGSNGLEVAQGQPGEIHVIGRWLAPGYWEDQERTASRFAEVSGDHGLRRYRTGDLGRLDHEGRLEHLGRLDHQIKIQGEWTDIPAIERACESAPGVAAAAVAAERDADGEVVLAAYLVPRADATPEWGAVNGHLRALLPPLAVPSRCWLLVALPLTSEGKLDRAALSALEARRLMREDSVVQPRDPVESRLAALWGRIIGVARIGIHDRWSDLGGTSLGAARVLAGIESEFGVSLSLADFMDAHTISELAALLRGGAAGVRGPVVPIRTAGSAVPLFCVHDLESDAFLFAALARRLGADQPVHVLRHPGGEPIGRVPADLHALAARYADAVRGVQPHGPYRLAGFCYGAVVALEVAHVLSAAGETVERLALLNVTPFDFPDLVTSRALHRFRSAWSARLAYIARKRNRWTWLGGRLSRVVRDRVAAWRDEGDLVGRAPEESAGAEAVRARLLHAFRAHRSRPFAGQVFLAPSAENLPLYADDAETAWRPLSEPAPHLAVQPRDGYAMMVEPDVALLADALEPWLANAGSSEVR